MAADIFADTAGWAHLFDPREPYHSLALSRYDQAEQQGFKMITTNYVIAELVALFSSPLRLSRVKCIEYIETLKASPQVELIYVDKALDEQAWQLLKARQDKEWSLVDCSSFVVMQTFGITEALTTDHHFEQAGFVRLLTP